MMQQLFHIFTQKLPISAQRGALNRDISLKINVLHVCQKVTQCVEAFDIFQK